MLWEIYDTASANSLEDFDTEDQALAWVWDVIREEGLAATFDLALGRYPGGPEQTLFGLALARRAFEWAAERAEHERAQRATA